MSATVVDTRDTASNKTKSLTSWRLHPNRETDNTQDADDTQV